MGSSPPFPPSEGEERDRSKDFGLTHFLSWPWVFVEVQLLLNIISLFLSLLMFLIYLCAYFALSFGHFEFCILSFRLHDSTSLF